MFLSVDGPGQRYDSVTLQGTSNNLRGDRDKKNIVMPENTLTLSNLLTYQ